jgi:hypothetical protein
VIGVVVLQAGEQPGQASPVSTREESPPQERKRKSESSKTNLSPHHLPNHRIPHPNEENLVFTHPAHADHGTYLVKPSIGGDGLRAP